MLSQHQHRFSTPLPSNVAHESLSTQHPLYKAPVDPPNVQCSRRQSPVISNTQHEEIRRSVKGLSLDLLDTLLQISPLPLFQSSQDAFAEHPSPVRMCHPGGQQGVLEPTRMPQSGSHTEDQYTGLCGVYHNHECVSWFLQLVLSTLANHPEQGSDSASHEARDQYRRVL